MREPLQFADHVSVLTADIEARAFGRRRPASSPPGLGRSPVRRR